jgi:hypothetical protein
MLLRAKLKLVPITIFLLAPIKVFPQKWSFHRAGKEVKDHKYEYWFHVNSEGFDADDMFQINSKIKLGKKEIIGIINCVTNNRKEFNNSCSDKSRYYVIEQI